MRYDDYICHSVTLALDLATYAATGDLAGLLDRQHDMLTEHGFAGAELSAPEIERLRAGGERIAVVLATGPQEMFLDALAALLDEQDIRPVLTRHDGTPHLHYTRPSASASASDWLAAVAVAGLVAHVCQHGRTRIRQCAASGCQSWYVDSSRNRSRRYCCHSCASRTTVGTYRSRQRGAAGA